MKLLDTFLTAIGYDFNEIEECNPLMRNLYDHNLLLFLLLRIILSRLLIIFSLFITSISKISFWQLELRFCTHLHSCFSFLGCFIIRYN
ncbi:DUF5658 family protein [Cytobacillus firmus]|uniref:DUF5658 family protein n=1 Tax=Cytobacillus TaxID=2675230 RepID=UPI001C68C6EB